MPIEPAMLIVDAATLKLLIAVLNGLNNTMMCLIVALLLNFVVILFSFAWKKEAASND